LLDDGAQKSAVETIEPELVNAFPLQGFAGDRVADPSVRAHLRKIANASKQPVRDARRSTASRGNRSSGLGVDGDAENGGGAANDLLQFACRIVI
jgi:hypothetical protein